MKKKRRATKYMGIVRLLEARVTRGDYALRKLPSENELAEETGVSRMTARKALTHLIEEGVLVRPPHGRLEVANGKRGKTTFHQIAFLMPPVISADIQTWQWAAEEAASQLGGILRPVIFTDWNDALIPDVLRGFDGVFLMPPGLEVPDEAIQKLKNGSSPVVSLDVDLSASGIPSIHLFPRKSIWKLLDHLYGLGHRKIACLNTFKTDVITQSRIDDWQAWKGERDVDGGLFNLPGEDRTIDYAAVWARKEFGRLLDEGVFHDTAVLCTNVWSALGVEKAMDERGLQVGRALSVCAINDEMLAPWLSPTLTALRMADMKKMLTTCVQWMIAGGKGWKGPKLMSPRTVPLHIGQSTGPAGR